MARSAVQRAILESQQRNRIVTLDWSEADEAELFAACDNAVSNGEVIEFWGGDEEPDDEERVEWRVHLEKSEVRTVSAMCPTDDPTRPMRRV